MDLIGISTGTCSDQPTDCTKARKVHDKRHFEEMYTYISNHQPFDADPRVRNIDTGIVATELVNIDNAREIGEAHHTNLNGHKISDAKLQTSEKCVTFATMRKPLQNPQTFNHVSHEQHRRFSTMITTAGMDLIFSEDSGLLISKASFLSNRNNKMRYITILKAYLTHRMIEVKVAGGDADRLIVRSAIQHRNAYDKFMVVSEDTDA